MTASFDRAVDIVDYSTLEALAHAMDKNRSPAKTDDHDEWKRYHDSLCDVLKSYGPISDRASSAQMFFHPGDWVHPQVDSFALYASDVLHSKLFFRLQDTVKAHHEQAVLWITGAHNTQVSDVEFFVTPKIILCALRNQGADACRKKLSDLEVSFSD